MFKRFRKFVKRVFNRLEERPATPFISTPNGQPENNAEKPDSPALFQDVIDLINSAGPADARTSTSTASTYAPTLPVTSAKYPWHDDCFYILVIEAVKTTRVLGTPVKRTIHDYRILTPNFECPNDTTDPLHWSHGPDDPLCRSTNDASVWCCSREHMYHLVDRCKRNLPNPPRCPHGCTFAKIINKENAFLQDRARPSTRGPVHTPVPWNDAGNIFITAPSASARSPAADRNIVFPVPEPLVDGRYVSLPVAGSHLLYESDMQPSTAYSACAAKLRPCNTTASASHDALPTPPESNTGTPTLIDSSDSLPRVFKSTDIPALALNGDDMPQSSKDKGFAAPTYNAM